MAEEPGTEQPTDDSAEDSTADEPDPENQDDPDQRPWSVERSAGSPDGESSPGQPWPSDEAGSVGTGTPEDAAAPAEQGSWSAHRTHDEPEPGEQIRRTDADRWASSFARIGKQPTDDQPSWSDRVPVPPAGPNWTTAVTSTAWTTDVPSGFNWGPDSGTSQDEPVRDHSASSRASLDRTAQALSANPPPPPPSGYPSPAAYPSHQERGQQPTGNDQHGNPPQGNPPYGYGNPQYGNQQHGNQQYGNAQHPGGYGGQQAFPYGEPGQDGPRGSDQSTGSRPTGPPTPGQQTDGRPGSRSGWSAPTAAVPVLLPPAQQWDQVEAAQRGWQPAGQQGPPAQQHTSAADLTSGNLVKPAAAVPRVGWRRMVHTVTGGQVNPGLSQAEMHRRNLIERATAPVRGCHRIAVVSLKGGIGKTTTTAGLGLTLAEHRGDRVVALDANPDAGTLAERLTGQVDVTVRDLLDNTDSIRSFTDVSAFTSLAARLQVLASEQDPEMSEAFSEQEYRTVADVLARYFNIVLTDSGTGLLHSAMSGTLALADSLVVVGSPSVDGASRASKTLDWLIAHGHRELVSRAVAVISTVRPATKELDMVRLREHFGARVRAVIEIPYDRHLVTGGIIDMSQLDRPTEQAFLELSATVADGFRLPALIRP